MDNEIKVSFASLVLFRRFAAGDDAWCADQGVKLERRREWGRKE